MLLAAPLAACGDDGDDQTNCNAGFVFDDAQGTCVPSVVDADMDGVAAEADCDDGDASLGARSADADCDGILTADDCDDSLVAIGSRAGDADCDMVPTAEDCDDADAAVGARSGDADCDGVLTADDCDDANAELLARADDNDCDGSPFTDDCDDQDPTLLGMSMDMDCDGILTADDCNDMDLAIGSRMDDRDCDGVSNASDECPDDATLTVSPPPTVELRFPTPVASTNANQVNVSGFVNLFCENVVVNAEATVNVATENVQTTATSTARASWTFTASLLPDQVNVITVNISDSRTRVGTASVAIEQYQPPAPPQRVALTRSLGITIDPGGNIAYVADDALPGVYAIDLNTGNSRIFSGGAVGSGDGFSNTLEGGIAFDANANRLLVTDRGARAIISVDVGTGARTVISNDGNSGPSLETPYGIVVDPSGLRAYVVDTTVGGVVEVDLASGDKTVLSAFGTRGNGVDISSPRGVAFDATNNRLLVVGTGADALVGVDLATGDRTIISDAMTGTGDALRTLRGVALDTPNNRALVAESANTFEAVVAIDLTTGNRTEISGPNVGTAVDVGADFDSTRGIIVDAANNRLIVVDADLDDLVAVDLATGNRSFIQPFTLPLPAVGEGPTLANPSGIVYFGPEDRLFVADDGINEVLSIDLATGDRTTIANSMSAGEVVNQPRGLGLDFARGRLLVPDNASALDAVLGIDIATGMGAIVSGDDSPDEGSETFASPRGRVALEPDGTTALVCDTSRDSLFRINLTTGERSTVAEAGDAELEGIQTVAVDAANNRALVTVASTGNDDVLDGLLAVDLMTGDRTTLANRSTDMPPVGTGRDMTNPRGLDLDVVNNRALILDSDSDALVEVDLTTLARKVVTSSVVGNGDLLSQEGNNTNAIAVDAENQRVFAVTEDSGDVVLIDLESGDQVVISR